MAKLFYTDSNNGVVAVMPAKAYDEMVSRHLLANECERKGLPRPQLLPVGPIFTFTRKDHSCFPLCTGSLELMERLLKGHEVNRFGGIWVPFSNGMSIAVKDELDQMTSLDEAIEAFGLVIQS